MAAHCDEGVRVERGKVADRAKEWRQDPRDRNTRRQGCRRDGRGGAARLLLGRGRRGRSARRRGEGIRGTRRRWRRYTRTP